MKSWIDMTTDEFFTKICPNTRICNALVREGVVSMARVLQMSEGQLMRVRNFGLQSLAIVLEEREKYRAEKKTINQEETAC